jgi:two-component system LytT family response regulator
MRILICDDDPSITQSLSQIIKTYFNKKKVNNLDIVTFNDGDSLLSDKSQKDIVFLDVEMPGFDGIYVGNELKKQNESVIIFIVTSYLEYLDAAMRFHVFRYLSKPIDKQRLFQNLDDALELYYSINQKIAVETKYGVTSVLTCDIVYVEAKRRNDALRIRRSTTTVSGRVFKCRVPLPSSSFERGSSTYFGERRGCAGND